RAMRGDGCLFQRHRAECPKDGCDCAWWIAFCNNGKELREAGGRTEKKAAAKLRKHLGEIQAKAYIGPQEERLTVGELLDALATHLQPVEKGASLLGQPLDFPTPRAGLEPATIRLTAAFGSRRAPTSSDSFQEARSVFAVFARDQHRPLA